jgi:UDP-N-acetylmuramoylalanine--D-glutamate ligase
MNILQNKNVLVLGLGVSGLAMARWCVRYGAQVTIVDTRLQPPQLEALKRDVPSAFFVNSSFSRGLFGDVTYNLLLVSPGIKPEEISEVITVAKELGVVVACELKLFSDALASLKEAKAYTPDILAITGTNGKTTVTSLTTKLIECSGKTAVMAGNIGPSLLDTLTQKLDADMLPQVWVLELSSFQLNDVDGFEPTAGVVLNITQDHLDWHGTMQSYTLAKSRVFGSSGIMLLNREDATGIEMLQSALSINKSRKYQTFGSDLPQNEGDYGLEFISGIAWLVRAKPSDETKPKRRIADKQIDKEIFIQRLMPSEALRIRGRHNALNALVALALAEIAGCSLASMLFGLREYRGEPHRVESIALINGIEYFDDSKGTNVGATVAALSGLGVDRKVVLILGGEGKNQDFTPLIMPVKKFAKAIVLIGRDKQSIAAVLNNIAIPVTTAETMLDAVNLATGFAHMGDVVLLSPACASFDMFENYEHRAQVFTDSVKSISTQLGESVML